MRLNTFIYSLSLALSLSACAQKLPSAATEASSTGGTSSGVSSVTDPGGSSGSIVTTADPLSGIMDINGNAVVAGQQYYFRNASTGQCLDVTGGGTDDGTVIDSFACGLDNPSQMWQVNANDDGTAVYLIAGVNNLSLDLVESGIPADGNFFQSYDYLDGPNQQYVLSFNGSGYQLENHQTDTQCVQDMGSAVAAETCASSANQAYVLIPATQDPSM